MRFCQITSPHNQIEIDEIIMSMSGPETEYIIQLYGKISMVEYTDDNGCECMFAILDDYLIQQLEQLYHKYSLKFKVKDLTKDVIYDNNFNTRYKNFRGKSCYKQIQKLIKEYKLYWTTKDDILDKILEKGIDSLTDFDFKILND